MTAFDPRFPTKISVIANSDFDLTEIPIEYYDVSSDVSRWKLACICDAGLYAQLTQDERSDTEKHLRDVGTEILRRYPEHTLDEVVVLPRIADSPAWRAHATRWLSGEGVNNQGRVRSDNIASLECDGLHFRSEQEIQLYRALKSAGVTFAPLAVFVRGGQRYARLEPDFVIIKDGHVMVVEVDGDTFHKESPTDAHQRLQPLDREGAKIERVRADSCDTPEKARMVVVDLLKLLDTMTRRR